METKLSHIATLIEQCLNELFNTLEDNPRPLFQPIPNNVIIDEVKALTLRGGKRIRAALIIAGYELFLPDGKNQKAVLDAACAMELFQTYLLIHDDIMDDDDQRRGGPSVHVSLAQKTNNATLGRNMAILAGDFACALQESLLAHLDTSSAIKSKVQQLFSSMHMEVIFGQTFDIQATAHPSEIVLRKTASYTTIGPLCIGAALGGATDEQLLEIAQFACPLGIAFQYRDDLLGVFGNEKTVGKSIRGDLTNNKHTQLLKHTLETVTPFEKELLDRVLGNPDATEVELDNALNIILKSGAKQKCEGDIQRLTDEAITCLNKSTLKSPGIEFISWLANFLATRIT